MPHDSQLAVTSSVSFLLEFARLQIEQRQPEKVRAAYAAAIDLDSGWTARNEFGCYLWRLECFEEAIEQFATLLEFSYANADIGLRATAANNLAAVYRTMGRYGQAAVLQQQSIAAESRASHGDSIPSDRVACDLTNRANDAIVAGDFSLAERLLRQSLSLEIVANSLEGQAADWGNLGLVAGLSGNTSAGIQGIWKAYRLHLQLGDDGGAGHDLMHLADLFQNVGRRQTAIACLRRAVRRFDRALAFESANEARLRLLEALQVESVLNRDPRWN